MSTDMNYQMEQKNIKYLIFGHVYCSNLIKHDLKLWFFIIT